MFSYLYKLTIIFTVLLTMSSCSSHRPFQLDLEKKNDGLHLLDIQHIPQKEKYDCGEGALAIVMNYWGASRTPEEILTAIFKNTPANLGTTAKDLADYAISQNFHAFLLKFDIPQIVEQIDKGRPVIVCRKVWGGFNHYEVIVGYDEKEKYFVIDNPAGGIESCSWKNFEKAHAKVEKFSMLVVPKEM